MKRALAPVRSIGALLVAALTVPTAITFQSLKESIGPVVGFRLDPVLYHIDVLIHGRMPWLWLRPILSHWEWIRAFDILYVLWFALLFMFFLWLSWTEFRVLRQRAAVAFVLMWIVAGTIAAAAAGSAGPCYYGHVAAGPDPYRELLARLDAIGTVRGELMARANQRGIWQLASRDQWVYFGGVSAMPSLHVGIAALFAIVGWRRSRVLGAVLIAYAALIQVGSVVLAWHYAVDGYAGIALAIVCWKLAVRLVPDSRCPEAAIVEPTAPLHTRVRAGVTV